VSIRVMTSFNFQLQNIRLDAPIMIVC